eukprot:Blabericola_migrator_1__997@NODE_124_length_13360_cov_167_053938_g110_i0_p10_GENE_NODE_124_length_13360_cov_167_053938_g110_i0NODE_124_length_13360_cov_167_053938_g110_i0_p10_ORF_typecomplete_len109_score5_87_NODE_124_length_13360_cov_167_053938_g110_i01256512891
MQEGRETFTWIESQKSVWWSSISLRISSWWDGLHAEVDRFEKIAAKEAVCKYVVVNGSNYTIMPATITQAITILGCRRNLKLCSRGTSTQINSQKSAELHLRFVTLEM